MIKLLDSILAWAASRLADGDRHWAEDLRDEAQHVPRGLPRFQFVLGGVFAAVGELLRIHLGPRRVGQGLVGFALMGLCVAIGTAALAVEDEIVKTVFYSVLPLYGLACALVVSNLRLMKRYTVFCSLILAVIWMALRLNSFPALDAHIDFLRAFSFEGAFIMAGLFIAASYLSWIEDARHG